MFPDTKTAEMRHKQEFEDTNHSARDHISSVEAAAGVSRIETSVLALPMQVQRSLRKKGKKG